MEKGDLVTLSEYVWGRTRQRLEALTDDELMWEPVPDCWTVRPSDDGRLAYERVWPPPDGPEPVTTLAWRIAHLTECYGQPRNAYMLGMPATPELDDFAITAAAAQAGLEAAYEVWSRLLIETPELDQPMGEQAGPFAADSRRAYVLHMLDEFIHHGAEIGVLRDLYRAGGGAPLS